MRYSHHMPDWVREHSLSGMVSHDDVASVLRRKFDERITPAHVAQWRRQHAKFESAVVGALNDLQAECMTVIGEAVRGGDVATAKWVMERTNERFKPSSKVDMRSSVQNLDDRLSRRAVSESELRAAGVLYDDETDFEPGRDTDSDAFYD